MVDEMHAEHKLSPGVSKIFIVDDDPSVREALTLVFRVEGFEPHVFTDGASFLEALQTQAPCCVILDMYMPGRCGLDLLKDLQARQFQAPVFVISGQGDIPMAVAAIKHGAFDFIEKPFPASKLVERVREAREAYLRRQGQMQEPVAAFPGADQLTPRERDVLNEIANGASNKEAGRTLGISPRTIEVHRARIIEKLIAKNAADLVRIVLSHRGGSTDFNGGERLSASLN